ncbi:hypothetical protein H4B97_21885 [Pseudomonas juntendi]|uniref:Uncharacterized protein n=1 Tax=Pseudomonas juntendi TaxID=2666183 RepID=A0A7W2LQA6_9PSED|nr:hypothetical protein [Pseudomonas juntendi]MBA6145083.1 hypothetical protein [Pseudomonas juntendi]
MTIGFQSVFDNGLFQIDSDFRLSTIAHRQDFAGPFGTLSTPFVATPYYFDVGIAAHVGAVFFACDTPIFIALMSKVGTTWRFRCSTTAVIRIYAYADQDVPFTNDGFQTFNSAGILTYDSGAKILRPVDIVRGAGNGVTKNWPGPSANYAAGIGNYPKRIVGAAQAGIPYMVMFSYGVTVGPTTYGVGESPILSRPVGGGGVPPPPASPAMQPPTLMCIDVSGH